MTLTELAKSCGAVDQRIAPGVLDYLLIDTNQLTAFADRILADERKKAASDSQRFEWYFSDKPKGDWLLTYLDGMKTGWTTDQWRAAIDAAMREALPATEPEMLQDCDRKLSTALSNTPGARLHARDAAAAIREERNV